MRIKKKLIALRTGMDYVIFQPFCLMLGAHMVLNIVIKERGRPSMHFSSHLALGVDLLLPTECNTETTLQNNHLRSLRIMRHNNHSIFTIIIPNIR